MPAFSDANKPVNVLFLQGPPSPFARELGRAMAACGAGVHRINLCIGDWLYWHGPDSQNYRGSLKKWPGFLREFVRRNDITDIVYFADRFPYHRIAQQIARDAKINAISYEYGYLRPDWIIVEPRGQSAYSHFPQELARIKAAAEPLPMPDMTRQYGYDFADEARGDVIYHLSNYLLWFLFPRFQRDRVYNPVWEYLSYIPRNRRARLGRVKADTLVEELVSGNRPIFVVPLQMQNDYQIRKNSQYADQRQFLDEVLVSFAAHAPSRALLVVKVHPLDNGIEDWQDFLLFRAGELGIGERVRYLDGGDLERLAGHAHGMITINSTSGMAAVQACCPVKVMGIAVYDVAGLTHQGPLDSFWTSARQPEPADAEALIKALAHHCHVRGNFYGPEGRAAAIGDFCSRLMAGGSGWEFFDAEPPRIDRARAKGIEIDA